jgi:hypothetical protein
VAREVSKRLKTRAVAAAEHDASLPMAQEWRNGRAVEEWSGEGDADDFYVKFYDREIAAPACWIGFLDGKYAFMSDNRDAIERVDFVGIVEGGKGAAPQEAPPLTFAEGTTGEDALRKMMEAMGVGPARKKRSKRGKAK